MKLGKILSVTAEVGAGATASLARGVLNTASDCASVASDLCRGNWAKAGETVVKRVARTATAGIATAGAAAGLAGDAISTLGTDKPFLTRRNTERLTQVATVGLAAALGGMMLGDDGAPVENGMFEGDEGDLQDLIERGEVAGTEHVDSEDISRDMAARSAFLEQHGYDGTPDGYEVHHIVPLCEGGPDTPENMVLVSEEDHDKITAAHRAYYGWNS